MNFDAIILCTDAPPGTGLAYYFYQALKDVTEKEIVLVDEEGRNYNSGLLQRGFERIKNASGKNSGDKFNRIVGAAKGKKAVVIVFNSANLIQRDIVRLSAQENIYLVHYLSDHLLAMHETRKKITLASLPYYDSVICFAEPLTPVLYQLGAKNVIRLPFAYCKYTHLVETVNTSVENSVYYFGTWTPTIEEWVKPLLQFDLHIEGSFWKNASDPGLRTIGTKKNINTDRNMASLCNKAGVVVNFTRAQHGCFHTMKTFELTAAGGAVVSNFSHEQDMFFKDGEAMLYFNTKAEMVKQVETALQNKELNLQLRRNALNAAKPHSYHARVAELINKLERL